MENNEIVKVINLKVWFGSREVLKGINLSVPRNVIFAIMGPSGSGKSTLLRTINRIIDLYPEAKIKGKVVIDGIDVYDPKVDPSTIRRKVGMVFQIPNPIPNMSIYDNVALGPKINKLVKSKQELNELVKWALEKAYLWDEVKDRLNSPAGKLSGGQQQRLCIARALAMKPDILLMDEPTANLDPVATSKIESLIIELKKMLTIIIVTHNPFQASRIADNVAFIYEGKVIETGPTSKIFMRPENELTEKYVTGKIAT